MSDRQTLKENQPPDEKADSKNEEVPKSYYYDDSTGYETYDAEADRDHAAVEDGSEGEGFKRARSNENRVFTSRVQR